MKVNVVPFAALLVPEITPDALKVSPFGSEPDASDQVYGDVPPVAASVVEYRLLRLAFGRLFVVMLSGTGAVTVIETVWVAVSAFASVTTTLNENVPPAVGVPESTPFDARLKPPGSVPVDDHVYGVVPPLAAKVKEYAAVVDPAGSDAEVVIVGAGTVVPSVETATV